MLRCVEYIRVQDVVGAHPGLTKVVTNVPRVLVFGEGLWIWSVREWSKADGMTWAEKRCVDIGHHAANFPTTFSWYWTHLRTRSAAKVCLLVDKRMWFVGCDKNASCLQASITSMWKFMLFCFKIRDLIVLKMTSWASQRVYSSLQCSRRLSKSLRSWSLPPGDTFIQTFQEHVVSYFRVLHLYCSMFDLAHYFPYTGCSHVWRRRMENLNMNGMLAHAFGARGVGVMKYTTEQDMAGMQFFCERTVWEAMVIGYYRITLICSSIYVDKDVEKRYRYGMNSIRHRETQTPTVHISEDVKDKNGKSCPAGQGLWNSIYFAISRIGGNWRDIELQAWGIRQMEKWQT